MKNLQKHFTKNILAGLVAILPVGGLIITIGYLETSISSSGLSNLPFYFPGFGIIVSVILIYAIGLVLTTFLGKWLWSSFDGVLKKLPALGKLYISLKQILGYGEGEDAIFQETVLIPAQGGSGQELAMITNRVTLPDGTEKLIIFIPGAPNPTTGRLVIMEANQIEFTDISVNEAFKLLVAAGKAEIKL